jgi:ligand-binding sensor domain-containing protein
VLAEGDTVLAATDRGLIKVGVDGKIVNLAPAPRDRTVLSMLRTRGGALWVGTSSEVGQLEPGGKAYSWLGEREGLAHAEVRGLAEDENGDIWVGYDGAGAARISASGFVTYGETDGLPAGQVASMALDRGGRLIAAINAVANAADAHTYRRRFARRHRIGLVEDRDSQ